MSVNQRVSGHTYDLTPGAEDKGTGKSVAWPETSMFSAVFCGGSVEVVSLVQ